MAEGVQAQVEPRSVVIAMDGNEPSRFAFHFSERGDMDSENHSVGDPEIHITLCEINSIKAGQLRGFLENIYRKNDKLFIVYAIEYHSSNPLKWLQAGEPDVNALASELKAERSKCQEKLNELRAILKNSEKDGEVVPVPAKKPGQGIIDKAQELNATCIITGTRGQNPIQRTLKGSVSDYILHHASIPVIVCRMPDH